MSHNSKKCIALLASAALVISSSALCAVPASAAKKLKLNYKKITLSVGASKKLKVKNLSKKQTVKWKSSKKAIASVNKNGTVKGKKAGISVITAKVGKNSLHCKVTVKKKAVAQPSETPKPTTDNDTPSYSEPSKNQSDVDSLLAVIRTQKAAGAAVSDNLNHQQYRWDETGRLIEINWDHINLTGSIVLTPFTALQKFSCNENSVTALELSSNSALRELSCENNALERLDVSHNLNLVHLNCYGNQLKTIDVSRNTALTYLNCGDNQLTDLDVTQNTALLELRCHFNRVLYNLNISNNPLLNYLDCRYTQLKTLDISHNPNIATCLCDASVNVLK